MQRERERDGRDKTNRQTHRPKQDRYRQRGRPTEKPSTNETKLSTAWKRGTHINRRTTRSLEKLTEICIRRKMSAVVEDAQHCARCLCPYRISQYVLLHARVQSVHTTPPVRTSTFTPPEHLGRKTRTTCVHRNGSTPPMFRSIANGKTIQPNESASTASG